ncbi:MAG TPA: 16S rRNA (cytosine(967)-C(5))-methyltransferase RsmB [Pyrinomonadaceae bacterium]|nr:16S rRNA (cytosine(967)-C(5))-methyltransferase RsmB [Pyrinomonadaceae bacterium]
MKSERRASDRQPGGAKQVSPARFTAFSILRRVEEENAFASVLLAAGTEHLSAEDRALCYELVLGVLRWQLWLDALIQNFSGRSPSKLDAPVRLALRLGLYQLRKLSRVPASAAVNESVNLVKWSRLRSAEGFVNAVLRRAARESEFDPATGISDAIERISIETSHPHWLVKRWVDSLGSDEARKFAEANNNPPPVAFRINTNLADASEVVGELERAGAVVTSSQVSPEAWRVEGASALVRNFAQTGRIYLQDEASQLVAHVVGARAGERILDLCAAPGSKSTHIAQLSGNQARIVACDIHEHRLRTVLEGSARQQAKLSGAIVMDALAMLPFPDERFDRVLVDAPCTGTGTLRRNPEIRWRIRPSDLEDLPRRQQRILSNASLAVRSGGRLVYSTCSVEEEENESVVSAFLNEHEDYRQIRVDVPGQLLLPDGSARTWPQRDGADGFFVAAFERRR